MTYLPMMQANGIPEQAAIDTEFINIPRNFTVETSETIIIAGDTPNESARPCKNLPVKSSITATSWSGCMEEIATMDQPVI